MGALLLSRPATVLILFDANLGGLPRLSRVTSLLPLCTSLHLNSGRAIVIQHAHGFWPGSISFPLIGEEVALDVRSANANRLEQVLDPVP